MVGGDDEDDDLEEDDGEHRGRARFIGCGVAGAVSQTVQGVQPRDGVRVGHGEGYRGLARLCQVFLVFLLFSLTFCVIKRFRGAVERWGGVRRGRGGGERGHGEGEKGVALGFHATELMFADGGQGVQS